MSFGLKYTGATYQWLVDSVFPKQIIRNIEEYLDGMAIKSLDEGRLLENVEETLKTLERVIMKLKPGKCTFGVEEGKFLGYYVTQEGI